MPDPIEPPAATPAFLTLSVGSHVHAYECRQGLLKPYAAIVTRTYEDPRIVDITVLAPRGDIFVEVSQVDKAFVCWDDRELEANAARKWVCKLTIPALEAYKEPPKKNKLKLAK